MAAPAHIARENGKKGGRPISAVTTMRNKTLRAVQLRIYNIADKIVNSQAVVALGSYKMITMSRNVDGIMEITTIKDDKRMQELLDTGEHGKDYFIVVGHLPDWKAAESLLSRGYGRPKETIQHDISFPQPLLPIAKSRTRNEQPLLRDNSTRKAVIPR